MHRSSALPEGPLGVFHPCLWPQKAPRSTFWGGSPSLSPALWPHYPQTDDWDNTTDEEDFTQTEKSVARYLIPFQYCELALLKQSYDSKCNNSQVTGSVNCQTLTNYTNDAMKIDWLLHSNCLFYISSGHSHNTTYYTNSTRDGQTELPLVPIYSHKGCYPSHY